MHVRTDDLPVKLDAPGATARQLTDFGDASDFGVISGEHLGLDGDTCHAPHAVFDRLAAPASAGRCGHSASIT